MISRTLVQGVVSVTLLVLLCLTLTSCTASEFDVSATPVPSANSVASASSHAHEEWLASELGSKRVVEQEYILRNNSCKTQSIKCVKRSCGCVSVSSEGKEIADGESIAILANGERRVMVSRPLPRTSGAFTFGAFLTTSDLEDKDVIVLSVKKAVYEDFELLPSVMRCEFGPETERDRVETVRITCRSRNRVELSDEPEISCQSRWVYVINCHATTSVMTIANQLFEQTWDLQLGVLPSDDLHSDYLPIRVKARWQGFTEDITVMRRRKGAIDSPSRISLGVVPIGVRRTRRFLIASNEKDGAFRVLGAKLDMIGGSICVEGTEPAIRHWLKLIVEAPNESDGMQSGFLTIRTDQTSSKEINIPVHVVFVHP